MRSSAGDDLAQLVHGIREEVLLEIAGECRHVRRHYALRMLKEAAADIPVARLSSRTN